MNESAPHRYEILGVLGQGGFGTVYRARMDGGEGFVKDVAIKLLNDEAPPDGVLRRFRDESRILGLVRDRAVIRVDPPVRLEGRWAVVMEYADGVSARMLLRRGPMPPRVALEIIQEVARALDSVYAQPGPDGTPLRLLHRDIKPANLQITPSGEVKVLDFGIARANFAQREAHTTQNVAGTLGYIAPERLAGEETPSGDIFSLGVVLRFLVTREKPTQKKRKPLRDYGPDVQAVLQLASKMAARNPGSRLTAEEVEERARTLVAEVGGMSLRAYARKYVPVGTELPKDDLVGQVLSRSASAVNPQTALSASSVVAGGVAAALSTLVMVGIGLALFVGIWWRSNEAEPVAPVPELEALVPEGVASDGTASSEERPETVAAGVNPVPGGTEAVVDAVAEGDVAQLDSCPDAIALEPLASAGRLSREERACAIQMAHDPGQPQTTRAKYGRVVLVDSQTRCASSGVCDEYEREQRFFFEEIDRSDPDMLYAWTSHLFGKGVSDSQRRTEVVMWANRALERKNVWKGTTHVDRVDSLYEMLARAHYAGFEAAPTDRGARVKAQNAAIEWLTYRSQLGKDHDAALKLCESASGSRSVCTDRMYDPGLQVVVTFVSVPIGATVMVDGQTVGQAPVVAELSHGVHSVEMVGSDTRGSTQITVGSDRETRWIWRSGTDAWEGSF